MSNENQSNMITVKQAAQIAGVSEQTVRRWIREARLKAEKVKVGLKNKVSVDENELRALLNS